MTSWIFAPHPRFLQWHSNTLQVSPHTKIHLQGSASQLFAIGRILQKDAETHLGVHWEMVAIPPSTQNVPFICLNLNASNSSSQSYHLHIHSEGIELQASSLQGIFYGLMTLRQLFRQVHSGELPCCTIDDSPDFPVRGVMLDVSRDKVPKLTTLFQIIDQLSEWKINQLQLYMEHTFAYSKHPDVWTRASPYTGEDILQLQEYCKNHFIELVPNQNSFGHLHRWLELPQYRHLSECPDGFDWPWGEYNPSPFSIAPHPESIHFLDGLYAELLPHFESSFFNVGCDETFDLGQGQSKQICEEKGKGTVYLDFLKTLYKCVKTHGKTMMFWGDIILEYPELVDQLPNDVVALEWGYEADHPFEEHGKQFAESGISFYVCPGTSAWNSLAGRSQNCIDNLKNAAKHGLHNGASGFLITDWGDRGHWQPLPVSYLGFVCGASVSWALDTNQHQNWNTVLNRHIFDDASEHMGNFWINIGNAYQQVGHLMKNNSVLFQLLFRQTDHDIFSKISETGLENTLDYINEQQTQLCQNQSQSPQKHLWEPEGQLAIQFLKHSCHRGLAILRGQLSEKTTQERLASEMKHLLGLFEAIWTNRNRIGGLFDSRQVLLQRLAEYQPSKSTQTRVF